MPSTSVGAKARLIFLMMVLLFLDVELRARARQTDSAGFGSVDVGGMYRSVCAWLVVWC